jgi:hypothetical protein
MKLRAPRLLYAVDRPDPSVCGEMRSVGGVPVLCVENRRAGLTCPLDFRVHYGHYLRAARDRQTAGWIGEVVLEIDDHEPDVRAIARIRVAGRPSAAL